MNLSELKKFVRDKLPEPVRTLIPALEDNMPPMMIVSVCLKAEELLKRTINVE